MISFFAATDTLPTSDRESNIRYLYEHGKFAERVESTNQLIDDLITEIGQENVQPVLDVIRETFDPLQMEEWILESLNRNYDEAYVRGVISFSEHVVFSQMLSALYSNQTDFEDAEIEWEFESYFMRAEEDESIEQRFDLSGEIIRKSRSVTVLVQMVEDVLTTVIFGLNKTLDADEQLTEQQMNDLIITFRANFRQLFNNVLPYTVTFALKDVPFEEIQSFNAFLDEPTGRWFVRSSNAALLDSFGEFVRTSSENIAVWTIGRSED